jgi:hypothetical protein
VIRVDPLELGWVSVWAEGTGATSKMRKMGRRKGTSVMAFSYCLDCANRIYLGKRPWVGQAVFCGRCGADLEVTHLNPLQLDWIEDLVDDEQDQLTELELEPA